MGQTEYVIPLIFLPEGRDAPLMCLEYCIYFIYLFIYLFILAQQPPSGSDLPHSRGF